MEALPDRQGDHHPYRSSALAVPSVTNQVAANLSFQVDGISSTVSSSNKVQKGTSNKVLDILSHPPISTSVILQNASLSFQIYVEQYANDDDFKEVYEKLTNG